MKKRILLSVMILAGAIVAYYGVELIIALSQKSVLRPRYLTAENLALAELSKEQLDSLIKVQDPNFYNHKGVDFKTPGNGWTTITQSIVKWLYFKNFKQGIRKIKQTLIARIVAHYHFNKDEQLIIFINNVWFDKDVVGLDKAAKYFFHKTVPELNQDEYLSLIAMIINPRKYNINTAPEENKKRVERIKKYLRNEYRPKGLFDIEYDR